MMKETIKKYYLSWLDGIEPYCSKVDKLLAAVIYIISGIALILVLSSRFV